jgi:hypothetical protein
LKKPYDPETNPKYINVKARGRDDVYFWAVNYHNESDMIVLVEDIISAVRVSKVRDSVGLLYWCTDKRQSHSWTLVILVKEGDGMIKRGYPAEGRCCCVYMWLSVVVPGAGVLWLPFA